MFSLFESRYVREKDRAEIRRLRDQYGENVAEIVKQRAAADLLSERDRKHWKRIARKI